MDLRPKNCGSATHSSYAAIPVAQVAPPSPTHMPSILVVFYITLLTEAASGFLLPSMWPYLRSVGGTKDLLGVFIAALWLGRMCTSLPVGLLADSFPASRILNITTALRIIGHALYIIFPSIQLLLFSRLVVGIGSGNLPIIRSYMTHTIAHDDRTYYFAYLSALQCIGFAVLPAAGGALSYLPVVSISGIALNGYTYPAFICMLGELPAIIATLTCFQDVVHPHTSAPTHFDKDIHLESQPLPKYIPIAVGMLANLLVQSESVLLETISSPFLMEQYGLSYSTASIFLTSFGLIALAMYLFMRPLSKIYTDRTLLFAGLSLMLLAALPLSITPIAIRMPLYLYLFFLGSLWSIAYPLAQTGVLGLFSKLLTGLPAGAMMGVYSASANLASVAYSAAAGVMWERMGRDFVYFSLAVLSSGVLTALALTWDHLYT